MLQAELKWLSRIPDEQLGKKYYNLKKKILAIQEVVLNPMFGIKV